VPPSVRPVECRRRVRVGISHIGAVKAAGTTARTVCPVGIAAIDEPDRGVARWRIGHLMEVVSRAGKYRPLVDQIHFRRAGLRDHDHSAAAVCSAAPAGLGVRHQNHCETRCDRKYTEEPNHPARARPRCRSGIRSPGHFTLPGLLRAAYRRGLGGTRRWALCRRANPPHKPAHDPDKACSALDAGWAPVFGKRSCSNKEVEQDDDSRKNHLALTA